MCSHLARDIPGGGNLSHFDAQAVEPHYGDTRAQFSFISKRQSAEQKVAQRSIIRELGSLKQCILCEVSSKNQVTQSEDVIKREFTGPAGECRGRTST